MAIPLGSGFERPRAVAHKRMMMPAFIPTATMVGLVLLFQTGAMYLVSGVAGGVQAAITITVATVAVGCALFPVKAADARAYPIPLLLILIGYAFIATLQLALIPTSDVAMYLMRMKFILFACAGVIILRNVSSLEAFMAAVRVAVVIAVVCNLADFFVPAVRTALTSFHPSKALYVGRAAGLFANPNFSAATLAAATAVGAVGLRRIQRLAFYAISFLGVFVTYSRGGLLLWLAAVTMCEFLPAGSLRRSRIGLVAGLALGAAVAVVLVLVAQQFIPSLNESIYHLTTEDTRSRLTTLQDNSAKERLYLIRYGLAQFAQSPVWGNGVGYGYAWDLGVPVHNVYVLVLVEHGLIGALWLALFFWSATKLPRPIGWWLATFVLLKGIFNHNVFNELVDALGLAAFWGAALFASERSGRTLHHDF